MDRHIDLESVLERFEDDDPGLYSERQVSAGTCQRSVATGWTTFPDDEEKEGNMDTGKASSSALSTVPATGEIFSY